MDDRTRANVMQTLWNMLYVVRMPRIYMIRVYIKEIRRYLAEKRDEDVGVWNLKGEPRKYEVMRMCVGYAEWNVQ